jgi:hypothetical protein
MTNKKKLTTQKTNGRKKLTAKRPPDLRSAQVKKVAATGEKKEGAALLRRTRKTSYQPQVPPSQNREWGTRRKKRTVKRPPKGGRYNSAGRSRRLLAIFAIKFKRKI